MTLLTILATVIVTDVDCISMGYKSSRSAVKALLILVPRHVVARVRFREEVRHADVVQCPGHRVETKGAQNQNVSHDLCNENDAG